MNAARMWPIAIVGVLAVTVGANVWILYEANHDPNASALESDYYRKAVAWDSTMAQADRDSALGWRLDATPGTLDPAGTVVAVTLADRGGVPLAGARIALVAIHNLEAAHELFATGVTGGDGRVVVRLPMHHAGLWELRFDVRHGADRFTSILRRDVGSGP
jgi:hypothetical protein